MTLLKEGEYPGYVWSATDYLSSTCLTHSGAGGGGSSIDLSGSYPQLNVGAGGTGIAIWDNTTISVNGSLIDNADFYYPMEKVTPFKSSFPEFDQVQKMCREYPGLARAYENFKTAYALVEQDWKGKQDDK